MTNAKLDNQFDEPIGLLEMFAMQLKASAIKPANIAWTVGVIATVGYVFSNALFMQDAAHPAAFFDTRTQTTSTSLKADEMRLPVSQNDISDVQIGQAPVTRIVLDSNSATAPQPLPVKRPATVETIAQSVPVSTVDNVASLSELQNLLAELGFYNGDVDGLDGPKTRAAIESYKANVGLKGIELTSKELITSAKNNLIVTAAVPRTRPQIAPTAQVESSIRTAPRPVETVSYKPPVVSTAPKVDETVRKIQAGLRAFGDQSISVDGVSGSQTIAAIKDFQSLFKLPVTGEIDQQLVEKMRSVGLID